MSVTPVEAFTPYSNVIGYGTLPTWMDVSDAQRILAYQIYEQIYWSVPETFKLVMRGQENASPIYIPTARVIVDTTNRYLAPAPGFIIDPSLGTPEEQETCRLAYSNLFKRERFWSKFQSNKLYGVMRGDWIWHVMANPAKPPGRRIKIEAVDPAAYFPVTHPNDPDSIIAVHIVEQVQNEEGDIFIKRQTYQRGADPLNNDGSDTVIWNSIGLFEIDKWEALDDRATTVIKPPTPLPTQITAIPVYHIRNIETPGDPFGSSELRGFERIMAAVNQAVSDEELALALEGLGMYETDGGPPRDEQGNITNWILGPGRVVEHAPGTKFARVNGVTSVDPVQNHLQFLINSMKEAAATPDVAIGRVDVTVAESGIALALQLGPLLSKVAIRSEPINDVHDQMFWDLKSWMLAYEGFDTPCVPKFISGTGIPTDRDKKFKEIIEIFNTGTVDSVWLFDQLEELGYEFATDTADAALTEAQARAQATDPFASRMDDEVVEDGE